MVTLRAGTPSPASYLRKLHNPCVTTVITSLYASRLIVGFARILHASLHSRLLLQYRHLCANVNNWTELDSGERSWPSWFPASVEAGVFLGWNQSESDVRELVTAA